MITVAKIDKGPNSGRWYWKIDDEARPVSRGRGQYTRPSVRQGIRQTEKGAIASAERAERFHHGL